jgi:hypothetical protein
VFFFVIGSGANGSCANGSGANGSGANGSGAILSILFIDLGVIFFILSILSIDSGTISSIDSVTIGSGAIDSFFIRGALVDINISSIN